MLNYETKNVQNSTFIQGLANITGGRATRFRHEQSEGLYMQRVLWISSLLSLFIFQITGSFGCAGSPPATEATLSECQDGTDNDGDGNIDCADDQCASFTTCATPTENTLGSCQDGEDNDQDDLIDCADTDCSAFTHCQSPTENTLSACQDTLDNDGDDLIDCADPDCGSLSICVPSSENTSLLCQDSEDNDGDGDVDCEDADCENFDFCTGGTEATAAQCQDNLDNDGDSDVDCNDSDCLAFTFCGSPQESTSSQCQDFVDNDNDELVDCEDPDCFAFVFCQSDNETSVVACEDETDNDGDNLVDCEDPDCQGFTFCSMTTEESAESCQDTLDNDGDEDIDCADSDCQGFTFCSAPDENSAVFCQDNIDNDGDEAIDCDDDDCAGFTFCDTPFGESTATLCQDSLDNDEDTLIDCSDPDCQGFTFCGAPGENTATTCQDSADNDGDTLIDCADPDCQGFTFCGVSLGESTAALCQDTIDNDEDTLIDCSDPDCQGFTFCGVPLGESTAVLCQDTLDNDGDTLIDCADPDCQGFTFCGAPGENTSASCQDSQDNDGDNQVDCDDTDCAGFTFCGAPGENTAALCQDNADNDGDTDVDCDDSDCAGFTFCDAPTENTAVLCQDTIDNDDDTLIDCDDPDCAGFTFCDAPTENTAVLCQDTIDNDEDTLIDCDDPDCVGFTFCDAPTENTAVLCQDTIDNDDDALIDCDDPDCAGFTFCDAPTENTTVLCQDTIDNDDDALIDCDDPDCQGFVFCNPLAEESSFEACQDGADNDNDTNVDCDDQSCWHWGFCNVYNGFSVVDDWGETWDGIQRGLKTWQEAKDKCESAGGRLPTPTELYRNNAITGTGNLGTDDDVDYLWTFIRSDTVGSYVRIRLSDGVATDTSATTPSNYRCVWPDVVSNAFDEDACHGDPDNPCLPIGHFLYADSANRADINYLSAVQECNFYNGTLLSTADFAELIHSEQGDETTDWLWSSETITYGTSNTRGKALVRFDSASQRQQWAYYNASGYSFGSYTAGTTQRYQFRCVGKKDATIGILPSNPACEGSCETLTARGRRLIVDSSSRTAANNPTAVETCRLLGARLPSSSQFETMVHAGVMDNAADSAWHWLSNFKNVYSNLEYNYVGRHNNSGVHWVGNSTSELSYANSTNTSTYEYRCVWEESVETSPTTCTASQYLNYANGQFSCIDAVSGTSCDGSGNNCQAIPAGVEVVDAWGNAWDLNARATDTWDNANASCQALGGRLPTPTEVYRVRVDNNATYTIGDAADTAPLWTLFPNVTNGQRATIILTTGVVGGLAESSAAAYRCVWPKTHGNVFDGAACHGEPSAPCFTDGALRMDKYDRARTTATTAMHECHFYGGRLPDESDYQKAIHAGAPNGSNNWLWVSSAGVQDSTRELTRLRWTGLGDDTWHYTNAGTGNSQAATSLNWFRCVYDDRLR